MKKELASQDEDQTMDPQNQSACNPSLRRQDPLGKMASQTGLTGGLQVIKRSCLGK